MKVKGTIILLITALIWGVAFVSQSVGADLISPFAFNGLRSFLGAAVLAPIAIFRFRNSKQDTKTLIHAGILCGIALGVASAVQTWGVKYTSVGNCGFITALYILFVPIVGVFFGKRIGARLVFSVVLALVGMYFLCMWGSGGGINIGDVLTFISSLCFTAHILIIDRYSPRVDGVCLSCVQFFVVGVLNCAAMPFTYVPSWSDIAGCAVPLLYAGVMSCGIAYTLQIIGQKYTPPTLACIVMSFESVFAAAAGWVILGDRMSVSEIFGSVLMFLAIIIAQLPKKIQTNV